MGPIWADFKCIDSKNFFNLKCYSWAQGLETDREKKRGRRRELLCTTPAWEQEECCCDCLQERGSAVILFHFRTQNLKRFFLEMCNGTVRKQTTPLPSSFLLKSFKASHSFHLCRHWELTGQDFFFFLNGIQAKMKGFFKKSLGKKVGSFSACGAGSPLNQFLISVLFPSIPGSGSRCFSCFRYY